MKRFSFHWGFPFRNTPSQPPPSSQSPSSATEALKEMKELLSKTIRPEIDEIESKEFQSESNKLRLKDLKDLAFDAQDIIAEYDHEMLHAKVSRKRRRNGEEAHHSTTSSGDKWKELEKRIGDCAEKYKIANRQKKALKLGPADGRRRTGAQSRPPTGSLPSGHKIFGRKGEIGGIIGLLTGEERKETTIIPVVGPAGYGKTFLIQHVYNEEKVVKHFLTKGWVFVHPNFDALKLTKAVYESIALDASDDKKLSEVQAALREKLVGMKNRCLLVLDDVSQTSPAFWEEIWGPLASMFQGSAVIISTRDFGVVKTISENVTKIDDENVITLFPFKDQDESKKLLFSCVHDEGHPELERNTEDIIRDCEGVPLKLKKAAGEFARGRGKRYWYKAALQGDIGGSMSSYRRLPARLKRCIAYCSVFPEGYNVDKDFLIRLWIAEDLIEPAEDGEELEEIASGYFEDLWFQSFLQVAGDDGGKFLMLANFLDSSSATGSFRTKCNDAKKDCSRVRHCSHSVDSGTTNKEVGCKLPLKPKSLSTFLVLYPPCARRFEKIDLSTLPNMKNLRVLDLSSTDLKELPELLPRQLKHLRFLGLNRTAIRMLPESLCSLYGLQTLELRNCRRLEELPKDTKNMISLRHLDLMRDLTSFCMPAGIGELSSLQTLSRFNVGRAAAFAGIRELENLRNLRGEFCISGLCNVVSSDDCEAADLKSKEHIKVLSLVWPPNVKDFDQEEVSDYDDDFDQEEDEEADTPENGQTQNLDTKEASNTEETRNNPKAGYCRLIMSTEDMSNVNPIPSVVPEEEKCKLANKILENLKPHGNLETLNIQSYDGTDLPEWLGSDSFKLMESVKLEDCQKCESLPSLGLLPSLESLAINHMPVQRFGIESCHGSERRNYFQKLRELTFRELYKWNEWCGEIEKDDFPELEKIVCFNCPELTRIPSFASLKTLELENCSKLKSMGDLPSLESLRLIACDKLKSIPPSTLCSLKNLTVMYCNGLVVLPQLPKLKMLVLEDCEQLKSDGLLSNYSSLESLSYLLVGNCPLLEFSAYTVTDSGRPSPVIKIKKTSKTVSHSTPCHT